MPLTQQQTKELGSQINERRNVLLAELREDAARTREQPYAEHAGPAPDSGDESVATLFADLEQSDLTRDLDEFRALEAARERIKEGGYGVCVDCGTSAVEPLRLAVELGMQPIVCDHHLAGGRRPPAIIANPALGRKREPIVLEGDVPSPVNPPSACHFHPRCPRFVQGHCDVEEPPLYPFGNGHVAACHYPLERWPMSADEIRRASSPVQSPSSQSREELTA